MNIDVKNLTDDQLSELINLVHKELDERKRKREQAAKDTIRKLAADVGLKVSFAEGKPPTQRKARKKEVS